MCFPYRRTSELDKVPMTSEVFRRSVSKHFRKITNKNNKNQPHSRVRHYGIRCRQLTTLGGETWPLIQSQTDTHYSLPVRISVVSVDSSFFSLLGIWFVCCCWGTVSSTDVLTLTFCRRRWRDSITFLKSLNERSHGTSRLMTIWFYWL